MKHLINKGLLLVSAFVMIYTHNTATDTRLIIALLLSLIAGAVCPALFTTRWQGSVLSSGDCAIARPTHRACCGRPASAAILP